jgi:putative membrane protein insertion efficiency factor
MRFLVLDILTFYKWVVSPFLPPACRFEPTCSEYARQAVEKYGALRGTWMGLRRILRCQPFCKGGHDPVR